MAGALILLAVLIGIAIKVRPRKFVPRNRRKLFDWLKDDSPEDQPNDRT